MQRRALIIATGLSLLGRLAKTSAASGPRRLAYLTNLSRGGAAPFVASLTDGLRDAGWKAGQNLVMEVRYLDGDGSVIPAAVADLLALKPDVFIANTDRLALAVMARTKTVPILFALGFDPVGLGAVSSVDRPGSNVTGFSILGNDLLTRRLALLKEAMPSVKRVGVIYVEPDPSLPAALATSRLAGQLLGLELILAKVEQAADIVSAFDQFAKAGVQALINIPHPFLFGYRNELGDLAIAHRLPSSFGASDFVLAGGLMSYAVDYTSLFRRVGKLVDQVFGGANPGAIAVQQVTDYELVINLRTARILGLDLPKALTARATRVID